MDSSNENNVVLKRRTRVKEDPEYYRKYYIQNKDNLLERAKRKYICPCGSEVSEGHRARHLKSKIHLKYYPSD